MGRAGVASVNDATAAFMNPAAMARNTLFQIGGPTLGAGVYSPIDVDETEDIIDNITRIYRKLPNWTPADAQALVSEIQRLDDDLGLDAEGRLFAGFKLPTDLNFSMSFSSRAVTDVFVFVDKTNLSTLIPPPANSVLYNATAAIGHAVWLNQVGLTFATPLPFFDENILVGATGIVGHATTYHLDDTVRNLALTYGETIEWEDRLRDNKEGSFFVDLVVGTQIQLFDRRLTLGITANHLLSPTLKRKDPDLPTPVPPGRKRWGDMTLDPQVRVGIAFSPLYEEHHAKVMEEAEGEQPKKKKRYRSEILAESNPLTITLDFDVTENKSALPEGIDTQYIGGGIEYAPASWVALRAGLYANLAETSIGRTITAGAQLGFLELGLAWCTRSADGLANDMRGELGLALMF